MYTHTHAAGRTWLLTSVTDVDVLLGTGFQVSGDSVWLLLPVLCCPGAVVEGSGFPVALPVTDGGIFWKDLWVFFPPSQRCSVAPGFAFLWLLAGLLVFENVFEGSAYVTCSSYCLYELKVV